MLYSFTIQPFQVRKTETQICDLHNSYSLQVCIWSYLRDLEPDTPNSQLSTRNSCEPEEADFHTLLFCLLVHPCYTFFSRPGQTPHRKCKHALGPDNEKQPGWQTYTQFILETQNPNRNGAWERSTINIVWMAMSLVTKRLQILN